MERKGARRVTFNILGQDGPIPFLSAARLRHAVCPFVRGLGRSPVSAPPRGDMFLQQAFPHWEVLSSRCGKEPSWS